MPPTVNTVTQLYRKVLVSSPIGFCSEIGRNVIHQGGNAIDSAIATHFCVGGLHPHSSGMGGELILLLHTGNSTVVVNGQIRSPRSVTENTYFSKPSLKDEGYASIGVPGALHALWTSFRKFGSGRVSWQSLIWPTVDLLERGYPVTAELASLLQSHKNLTSLLGDVPSFLEEGDFIKSTDYADTLRRLAQSRDPVYMFYKGDIANHIVSEMKNKGGLITKLDLVSYESVVEEPLFVHFNDNFTLVGPPPPSAFAAYQLGVRLTLDAHTSSQNVILKAFQTIGDPTFFPESRMLALNLTTTEFRNFVADLNTSASTVFEDSIAVSTITVADPNGAIVSIDSTLVSNFGSKRRSEKLGWIWNNGMSAFSLSDDEEDVNSVQGSKRARTHMAPIILLEKNELMIEIGRNSIVFEQDCGSDASSSTGTRNFFDKSTSRICTVRNNGALSFTCKTFGQPDVSTRTKDKGPATDVKISPNGKLASVQRNTMSVDIILMDKNDTSGTAIEFNVPSKSREPIILVEWVTNNQILFVTSQSMELMSILEDKKTSKLLRSSNISTSWAIYYAPSNLLVLGTGPSSSVFQPIVIHHGQFTRLKPFEIETTLTNTRDHILEKDVFLASIYGSIYTIVIRYNRRTSSTAELLLFELSSDVNVPGKLKYVLSVSFTDGFGINIVDNLVLVHHQPSARSLVYDVALALNRPSHSALITTTIVPHASCQPSPNLYNVFWKMFLPDIVADPEAGMMYQIGLKCEAADNEIDDKSTLLEFFINRTGQENLIMTTLLNALRNRKLALKQIRKIFGLMTQNLIVMPVLLPADPTKSQLVPEPVSLPKLDQKALQGGVFIPLKEDTSVERTYVADVMLQYLNSLNTAGMVVDPYFLDMLVEVLAEGGQMQKLQQLVTYRVIDETKQLAYMLVSYAARCPHIANAALDILSRQKATEEILEVMLEKGFVVEAARFVDIVQVSDTYIAKLVEATAKQDRQKAFAVHAMLARRNRSEAARLFQYAKSWMNFTDTTAASSAFTEEEIAEAEKQVALCQLLE